MTLRPYQKDAVDAIWTAMSTDQNILLSAIMGAGKTIITAAIIDRLCRLTNYRVIIMAHRSALVEQFRLAITTFTDIPERRIGIACAGLQYKTIIDRQICIGTVGTVAARVQSLKAFDLIVVDEVHTIERPQYKKIILPRLRAIRPGCRLLGLTATPWRMQGFIYGMDDEGKNKKEFKKINHKITYEALLTGGYLMPLKAKIIRNKQLKKDLTTVGVTGSSGDYKQGRLGEKMELYVDSVYESIKKYGQDDNYIYKKIAVFGTTIAHCQKIYDTISPFWKTVLVHSKQNQIENKKAELDFRDPDGARVIIIINKLAEGWDYPPTDMIIGARPSLSGGLMLQIIGRVLRKAEGKKQALFVDLAGVLDTFGTDLDNFVLGFHDKKRTIKLKICEGCDTPNNISIEFCQECGQSFLRCPACKYTLETEATACPGCDTIVYGCPRCRTYSSTNYDKIPCAICDYVFRPPVTEVEEKGTKDHGIAGKKIIDTDFTTNGVTRPVTVANISYEKQLSHAKPPYIRVDYKIGRQTISEWLLPEHKVMKSVFKKWWLGRGGRYPVPETTKAFFNRENEIYKPTEIVVRYKSSGFAVITHRGLKWNGTQN